MTTKLDIVTIFVFRTVVLPKPGNVLGITYPCFSIRYLCKLLPNYTLIAKSFFDNIGVTKLYICVNFCDYWQNKSFFVDLLYILVRLSSNFL